MAVEFWVLTALLGAVGGAGLNIWQKLVIDSFDEFTVALQSNLLPILLLSPLPFLTGAGLPQPTVLGLLFLSGVSNAVSYYLFAKGLVTEDVSVIAPLRGILPVLLALIEPLVFGFSYRSIILLASTLTATGIYILLSEDELVAPIKSLKRRGVQYGFLSPITIVFAVFLDRTAFTAYGADPLSYSFYLVLSTSIALLLIFAVKDFQPSLKTVLTPTKKTLPLGIFRAAAIVAALYTVSITTGTNYTIIKQLGLLIPVLVGGISLNEDYTIRRVIGAIALICGSFIIVFFT